MKLRVEHTLKKTLNQLVGPHAKQNVMPEDFEVYSMLKVTVGTTKPKPSKYLFN